MNDLVYRSPASVLRASANELEQKDAVVQKIRDYLKQKEAKE